METVLTTPRFYYEHLKPGLNYIYFLYRAGRSFFRRLRARFPELKPKRPQRVDVNRGLNCTREMAINHLDELAEEINFSKIGTLVQEEPGVWNGQIDLSR